MDKEFDINNPDFASYLAALAVMCANNGTDNCEITINTNKGAFKCEITFSPVNEDKV